MPFSRLKLDQMRTVPTSISLPLPPFVLAALVIAALFVLTVQAADRDALKHIVQDQCLPHWRESHDPTPCARIVPPDFAVLADRKGGAHYLLIATGNVTGIEDPAVLSDASPNYFAAAWTARDRLDSVIGHPLRREAVGLAINSAIMRGQDQMHIHIECVKPDVSRVLHAAAAGLSAQWSPLWIDGRVYSTLRIDGEDLSGKDPFRLLANGVPGSRADMRAFTIVVVGMQFAEGAGFVVLAGRTAAGGEMMTVPLPPPPGLVAPGETLLDSTCAIDRQVPQVP
jgi:CDP-diacylglycerol pyrophosphatase